MIIPQNRQKSFSERLGAGIGQAGQAAAQLIPQYMQQQEQLAREKQGMQQLQQLTGVDFTGLSPDLQKAFGTEILKQQGKGQRQGQTQSFLDQLFKGGSSQQNDYDQGMGMDQVSQKQGQFNPVDLTDAQIAQVTAMDPNVGRSLQHAKDVGLREKREGEKLQLMKELHSPEHKREMQIEGSQAQADVKYNQELQNASKQHELKEQSLDRLEKLNEKGVTGKPYEKLLEKAGLVSLTSEGRREFAADVKNLITDIRSILGGQFSNFEFQTILNAYPSVDFSQGANAAIIRNLKGFQDIKTKEVQFANQIKKENDGKLPYDFQSQVNEKVREYANSKLPEFKQNTREIMNEEYGIQPGYVLMFDPQGEPLQVHPSEVDKYLELGAINP
jgi:hypothetical protein